MLGYLDIFRNQTLNKTDKLAVNQRRMSTLKKWTPFNFDEVLAKSAEKSTPAIPQKQKTTEKGPSKKGTPKSTNSMQFSGTTNAKYSSFNFFKKIEPREVEDLAVHPKKLAELESWLNEHVCQVDKRSSLLLVTGPSGCGKTAATQVLCKKLAIGCTEWQNPMSVPSYQLDRAYDNNYLNQVTRFTEFLVESNYGNLFSKAAQNIGIVKDFPNTFLRNPEEFTTVLQDISEAGNVRVIFIATDDSNTATNIERNLFPDAIKAKFNVTTINFNACAATLMKHAIKRAQKLLQSQPELLNMPTEHVIEAICSASTGDIRCCINQFYLAALKGSEAIPIEMKLTMETKTGTKRKRPTKTATLKTKLKDETLGLFHSVGRVLHPKIDPATKKIHHNLELLIDEFSTMPSVFLGFMQENYVRYFGDITDAMHASDYLSISQGFMEKWSDMRHETYIIGLYIAVMGLMLHNKHRISMWNPIKGPVKIKQEEATVSQTLRVVSPLDVCYYNVLVKKQAFNRFAQKL